MQSAKFVSLDIMGSMAVLFPVFTRNPNYKKAGKYAFDSIELLSSCQGVVITIPTVDVQ